MHTITYNPIINMPIDKPTKSNHHSRVTKKNVEISTNEQLIFNISRNGIRFEFDLMIKNIFLL